MIDKAASNSRRTVIRWHPIIAHTRRDVWETIRDHQIAYHWAYDLGADRHIDRTTDGNTRVSSTIRHAAS